MSRVAIVTGAGSGIGHASSLRLQEDGMTVIALDVDVESAAEVSPNALALDVSDAEQVSDVMAEVLSRWPRIAATASTLAPHSISTLIPL